MKLSSDDSYVGRYVSTIKKKNEGIIKDGHVKEEFIFPEDPKYIREKLLELAKKYKFVVLFITFEIKMDGEGLNDGGHIFCSVIQGNRFGGGEILSLGPGVSDFYPEVEDFFKEFGDNWKYYNSTYSIISGPQNRFKHDDFYCYYWSLYFALSRLMNPDIPMEYAILFAVYDESSNKTTHKIQQYIYKMYNYMLTHEKEVMQRKIPIWVKALESTPQSGLSPITMSELIDELKNGYIVGSLQGFLRDMSLGLSYIARRMPNIGRRVRQFSDRAHQLEMRSIYSAHMRTSEIICLLVLYICLEVPDPEAEFITRKASQPILQLIQEMKNVDSEIGNLGNDVDDALREIDVKITPP